MMVCLDIAGPAASESAQQLVTESSPERAHRAAAFFPACAPPCGGPVLRNTPTPRKVNPTKLPMPCPRLVAHTLNTDALRAGRYNLRKEFGLGVIRI
jgi:hypothetical protein